MKGQQGQVPHFPCDTVGCAADSGLPFQIASNVELLRINDAVTSVVNHMAVMVGPTKPAFSCAAPFIQSAFIPGHGLADAVVDPELRIVTQQFL